MSLPKSHAIFVIFSLLLLNLQVESAENYSTSVNYHEDLLNSNIINQTKVFHNVLCNEEEIFDEEINSCRVNCSSPLIFSQVTKSCLDEKSWNRVNERVKCKPVTLGQNNYQIFENGSLKVNRSKILFSPANYSRVDGKIKLCFPFTNHFILCEKWVLYDYEFEVLHNGLTIRTEFEKDLLEYGEFYFQDSEAVVCHHFLDPDDRLDEKERIIVIYVYSVAWTISAISLAITILVFFLIYKTMKYQIIMSICHMATLFTLYIFLVIRAWSPPLSYQACVFFGFSMHYLFLAAFFWLNVLAYDVWKNLPSSSIKLTKFKREKLRFILMSVYAWGCPLVIAISALLVDFYLPGKSKLRPQFKYNCWFLTFEAKLLFMYGFAGLILICNSVFFVVSVIKLRKFGNDAVMFNKKVNRQLFRTNLKLIFVMGITWALEVASGLVVYTRYWYAIDFLTGLQGFFLFVVYVCRSSVLRNLRTFWQKNIATCGGLCKCYDQKVTRTESSIDPSNRDRENSLRSLQSHEVKSNLSILPSLEYTVNAGSENPAISSETHL